MRHSTALRGCRSRISLGANVVEKQKQEGRIEPYTHPAAGWGALKYVAINLIKEKVAGGNYRIFIKGLIEIPHLVHQDGIGILAFNL